MAIVLITAGLPGGLTEITWSTDTLNTLTAWADIPIVERGLSSARQDCPQWFRATIGPILDFFKFSLFLSFIIFIDSM